MDLRYPWRRLKLERLILVESTIKRGHRIVYGALRIFDRRMVQSARKHACKIAQQSNAGNDQQNHKPHVTTLLRRKLR